MKICAGMIAKILDFTFAGYGFVCDRTFPKIIFHHIRYHYTSCRNFIVKCYSTPFLKEYYTQYLSYELDAGKERGLKLFLEKLGNY